MEFNSSPTFCHNRVCVFLFTLVNLTVNKLHVSSRRRRLLVSQPMPAGQFRVRVRTVIITLSRRFWKMCLAGNGQIAAKDLYLVAQ